MTATRHARMPRASARLGRWPRRARKSTPRLAGGTPGLGSAVFARVGSGNLGAGVAVDFETDCHFDDLWLGPTHHTPPQQDRRPRRIWRGSAKVPWITPPANHPLVVEEPVRKAPGRPPHGRPRPFGRATAIALD